MNHGKPPSAAAVRAQRVLSIRWQRSETRYCSDTLLRHNPRCRGSRLRAAHMQALPSPSSLREARRRGRTSRVHRSRSASSSRRTASGTPRPSQFGGLRRPLLLLRLWANVFRGRRSLGQPPAISLRRAFAFFLPSLRLRDRLLRRGAPLLLRGRHFLGVLGIVLLERAGRAALAVLARRTRPRSALRRAPRGAL